MHVNRLQSEHNGNTWGESNFPPLSPSPGVPAQLFVPPWHIDLEMKWSLGSRLILNAMTQDSVAGSLDRCMLGDLCACPPAGPQEQILTVYFSKLKATGRQ